MLMIGGCFFLPGSWSAYAAIAATTTRSSPQDAKSGVHMRRRLDYGRVGVGRIHKPCALLDGWDGMRAVVDGGVEVDAAGWVRGLAEGLAKSRRRVGMMR